MPTGIKKIFFSNTSIRQTVFKNTFWLTLGQIISRILRAVIIIYAARILGANSYGALSYALSLIGLFSIFSDIGLTSLLTREVSRNNENYHGYLATSLILKLILVVLSMFLVIFIGPLVTKIPESRNLLLLASFLLAFDSMRDFLFSIIRAKQRMEIEAIITIVSSVFLAILSICILFVWPSSKNLITVYVIISAFTLIAAILVVRKNLHVKLNQKINVSTLLMDAWPFALLGILSGIMVSMDTLMLGWFTSATEVGLYSAAQRPILFLYTLPSLFATSLFPLLAKYAQNDKEKFRNILEISLALSFAMVLPIVVGGLIVSKSLILLMYGPAFASGAAAFSILLFTLPIVFPTFIISDAIVSYNGQRKFFFFSLLGVIGDIILNLILIPKYGIAGAAISTVFSQAIVNIVIWKKLKQYNYFSILPHLKRIIPATILMGLLTFFQNEMGLNVIINILVSAIVFIVILFILKEPLLREYKKILHSDKPSDSNKKRVVIVRANEVSPDVRVEKIAESLHSIGYEVKVIAWNRLNKLPKNEVREFGEIKRIHITAGYSTGIKLIPKILAFWVTLFFLLLKERVDVIHACDFDTIIPSLIAGKLKNKKIIYDIFDFYAEGGNVPRILAPTIRALEKVSIKLADKVIIVDEVRMPYIPKSAIKKTEIIYNSPRNIKDSLADLSSNFPRIPTKKERKFRVVYSGNLIDKRYIIDMINAVSQISNAEMLIAGFGPESYIEKIKVAIRGTENIFYLGKNSSHIESLVLQSNSDLIFALNSTEIVNNRMMSSNKLFEAMMLGKPVLVNKGTSMEEKVIRYNCGTVIKNVNTETLKNTIINMQNKKDWLKELGENGRKAFLENYQWENMEKRLANIYRNIQ